MSRHHHLHPEPSRQHHPQPEPRTTKPWKRATLFWMLFGYVLIYGVRAGLWRHGLGFEDVILMAIGAWIVWLVVADLSKVASQEPPKRGGWRRRFHYRSKPPQDEHQDDQKPNNNAVG
jgi:hypothetical protein